MKVLQVSGGALSGESSGGAERCCLELSRWLAASEIDVMIAAPGGEGAPVFQPMAVLAQARWKPLRKLLFDYVSPENARRLRQIISEFKPDVVHVHNIYGISSQLVRVASQRAPTLVTVHDYWPVDVFVPRVTRGQLRYPLRHQVLLPWVLAHRAIHRRHLRSATLASPSRYLARRLEQFGYRDVHVIPNGVTLPEATPAGDRSMLFVGRLVPEKGLQEVLGQVEAVAREFSWRIDVVGEGPLRAKLEQDFPSAHFHGWADPAPFYQQAGIVLVPSLWPENFGYAVLEAMGYGLPVLASNVGGIPEISADGTGLLYDPDVREEFVSALRGLVRDASLRDRLGRAARDRIAHEFTWDSVGPRYLALYRELAPSAALPAATAHV